MQNRVVMLVDLDYFFAQCEEKRNPSLRGRPLVVCVYSGRSEDSGAVSTANYMARELGVNSGLPIYLAKKRLEDADAAFLPVDRGFYETISQNIMSILRRHADHFEQVGIDEAYLDVSQRVKGNFETARAHARNIKKEVKAKEKLSCSIGVGPNKLVAKIAADIQKPDGLTIVEPDKVERFLSPLPVRRLMGVGRKTEKKMERLGVKTIGDLAKTEPQRLTQVFGKNLGGYFHRASIGFDEEPVQERGEAESISRISTLKVDTRDLEVILEVADRLCKDVHSKVMERGLSFRSVGLHAVLTNMTVLSRSRTFENPTDNLETFKKSVKELLERLLSEIEIGLRRVGVKVSNLVREQKRQKQLTNFVDHTTN